MEVLQFQRLLIVLMVGGVISETKIRYDSHKILEIQLEQKLLPRIKREIDRHFILDQDESRQNRIVTLLVEPNKVSHLELLLKKNNVSHNILNVNFQRLIDDELKNMQSLNVSANGTDFGWKSFYQLETIYAWLDHLAEKYSDIITLTTIGTSYEGRPLKGVKLSHKKDNTAVFIEAGIHAREWIAPATATFILNQLLTSTDSRVQYFAKNFNWLIFPVCNPDGYKYTFDKDRMWRKNREPFGSCYGVDLNRNWNDVWGSGVVGHCSDTFPGPYAFSAPETRAISAYLLNNVASQRIQTYLSFHAPAQQILFPYAVNDSKPPNYYDLKKIGEKAVEALANRHGTKFDVGAAFEILYEAQGTSLDWVYSELKVPIVFTYELRRSAVETEEPEEMINFMKQFLLPVNQIEATGFETLDSVLAMLDEAKMLGYYKKKSTSDSTPYCVVIFYCIGFGIFLVMVLTALCFAKKWKLCWRRRSDVRIEALYHVSK